MTRLTDAGLDSLLRSALRRSAQEAPLPAGVLRVPARWIRAEPAGWHTGRIVAVAVAAVVVTLAILALLGQLAPPRVGDDGDNAEFPVEWLGTDPTPLTHPAIVGIDAGTDAEVVQLAHGRAGGQAFRVAAWSSSDGYCLWLAWAGPGGSACGPLPQDGPGQVFGPINGNWAGLTAGHLAGMVVTGAARVEAEATDGRRAAARLLRLESAGIDAQAFVVFLPAGFEAQTVVATDHTGTTIGSFDLRTGPQAIPGGGEPGRSVEPRLVAVLRNHTEREVDLGMAEIRASSEGSMVAATPPCNVAASSTPLYSGLEWSIDVDGVVVVDSDGGTPAVGSGEAFEIVIDLIPGEEPTIVEMEVRPVDESAYGPASGRDPVPWWSDRMWQLAAGLNCAFEPGY